MTTPIYKVLLFLKRNPAMTLEEFRHAYETVHAPWGVERMDQACRYVRRYATLVGAPHADVSELDFDVIVEVWYKDKAKADAMARKVAFRQMEADALPREAAMFDGPKTRVVTVVECDSDMGR